MHDDMPFEPGRGVYDTNRAAALSGVPARTLRYWAGHGIYRPSIAPDPRPRLWSWADLLALRAIDWFRRSKGNEGPPPVSMQNIRQMLKVIDQQGESTETLHRLVAVSESGDLFLRRADAFVMRADGTGQLAIPGVLRLVAPYQTAPDLLRPRPLLRIIPGKLHGEPHVRDTRVSTAVLYRLNEMGYPREQILAMYPSVSEDALIQAIELEQSLSPAA
jgi:uncharacterized protein (DUF433 family)/DNA-binding transcriptional MerR regulator